MKKNKGKLVRDIDYINNLMGQCAYAEDVNNEKLLQQSKSALVTNKTNIYKMALLSLNRDGNTYKFILDNFKKVAKKNTLKTIEIADTWKEAELLLQKIDLRIILNENIALKEPFKNDLFSNQTLYINQIKDFQFGCTKYRLFFRREKVKNFNEYGEPDKFEKSYTIVDLYMMIFQKKYYEAMEELTKMFKIKISNIETKFKNNQEKKLDKNLMILNDLKGYPSLYSYISKYMLVLRALNLKAKRHILSIDKSYKKQSVFYTTARSFEVELVQIIKEQIEEVENFGGLSYSTIDRLFQLYRIFGLLEVVPDDQVPQKYKDNAPPKVSNLYNDFMYFIIPVYDKITLAKAERIAKKLAKAGFVISQIKRKRIEEIMGKEFSDNIYRASVSRYERAVERSRVKGIDAPQEFEKKRVRIEGGEDEEDDEIPFESITKEIKDII